MGEIGLWGILLAIIGGAIRVCVPYLYVSLGECITEKSGVINLGHEGNLVMGAMTGYGVSLASGSVWLGVMAAGGAGLVLGAFHAWISGKKGVNDIALGIAVFLFGIGLAFFFGKPLIRPTAPRLGDFSLAWWSEAPQLVQAFKINWLFVFGLALSFVIAWSFSNTRWGLQLRAAGENAEAAAAMGYSVKKIRLWATALGGVLSGIGGSYLSLYYPGSWNEGLSSGQGLMAVALVIFAKWKPRQCLTASLLFGGAGALGPALQSIGVTSGYYLANAAPYILTLILIVMTSSAKREYANAPGELNITN